METFYDLLRMDLTEMLNRPYLRQRRQHAKRYRLKTLVCVMECPKFLANIASVIRNVNALGVSKLYIVDPMHVYKANDIKKLSVGSDRWTFVRIFPSTRDCIQFLIQRNYISVGTSPHLLNQQNVELHSGTFTDRKLAVWFGNETHGLSQEALEHCDRCVQIPMRGMVESYNLASYTAIVLYVISQQRLQYKRAQNISHPNANSI